MFRTLRLDVEQIDGHLACTLRDIVDEFLQQGAVVNDSGCRDRPHRAGTDVESAESPAARRRSRIGVDDRPRREQISVDRADDERVRGDRRTRLEQRGVDGIQLRLDRALPPDLVDRRRLVRPGERPGPAVDLLQDVVARLLPRVLATPLLEQCRAMRLDLVRPARERTNRSGEVLDLARGVERVAVTGEGGDPMRVRSRRQLTFSVDHGVELHRDARVDCRPLAVAPEHLRTEPQVPVDVRVERSRPTVLQLDDLDAGELFSDEPTVSAPRVELALPGQDDPIAQAVLQRLELLPQLGVQQGSEAVSLGRVDRAVENEIRVRGELWDAASRARDRVFAVDPPAELGLVKLVVANAPIRADEASDGC